jgi:hypothetical protein
MRAMNSVFTFGSLVFVIGLSISALGFVVPVRSILEPSLCAAASGVIVMVCAPLAALVGWLIGWRD